MNNFVKELKAKINYSEEEVKCAVCKYSKEEADPHLDRSWNLCCHISDLEGFMVQPFGRCSKFVRKEK